VEVVLTHNVVDRGESMGEGNNGGSMGEDDVYISNGEKVVLALLFNLYSKLNTISVGASGPSSCPTLHHLLTIFLLA